MTFTERRRQSLRLKHRPTAIQHPFHHLHRDGDHSYIDSLSFHHDNVDGMTLNEQTLRLRLSSNWDVDDDTVISIRWQQLPAYTVV